jgi:hypothetical protein
MSTGFRQEMRSSGWRADPWCIAPTRTARYPSPAMGMGCGLRQSGDAPVRRVPCADLQDRYAEAFAAQGCWRFSQSVLMHCKGVSEENPRRTDGGFLCADSSQRSRNPPRRPVSVSKKVATWIMEGLVGFKTQLEIVARSQFCNALALLWSAR